MSWRRNAVAVLVCLPMVTFAQQSAPPPPASSTPSLTEAQLYRLLDRMNGTWRINPGKSANLTGAPSSSGGFIYIKLAERKGIQFRTADGESFQGLDGKPYPSQVSPMSAIARLPIDEFTVENRVWRDGRLTSRNTAYFSPDGKASMYITREVNERGEETPRNFLFLDKVPDGTKIWAEKPGR
jgi:hypothetical protein